MMKRFVFLLTIILSIGIIAGTAVAADDKDYADRVVILMVDRLNLEDINPELTPALWSLQEKGAMGLLNTVSGGERNTKNNCVTLSSGKRAVGSSNAQLNYKAVEKIGQERAGDIFYRNTGLKPENENVVVSSIEVVRKNNERRSLGIPGQLGDSIHGMGYTTAVVGSSDRPGYTSRPGALMLMDSKGIVDYGFLGKKRLIFWTDYREMAEQFDKLQNYQVVLFEFGDLTRLEAMYSVFEPERYQAERKRIIQQIDRFIADIQKNLLTDSSCIYMISPTPSREGRSSGEWLTPLIIVKPGFYGSLSSYSTRRDGVVSGINIKNSILNCLYPGINEAIFSVAADNTYVQLQALKQRAVFNYANRTQIISILLSLALGLIIAAFMLIMFSKCQYLGKIFMVFVLSIPLSLLFMAKLQVFEIYGFLLLSLGISLLLTGLSWMISRLLNLNIYMPVLFFTIMLIAIDLLFDLGMIKNSIMSYQIITGARYYGLGNEYMGILIGATIAFTSISMQRSSSTLKDFLLAIIFTLMIFIIACPLFGINVGGAITASIAMGYTYLRFKHHNMSIKKVIILALGTVIVITIMACIDLHQALEVQSHLGRNISLILNGGINEIINIINRKLQMHIRIIGYSSGGWIFLFLVFISAYYIFKPNKLLTYLSKELPYIYRGLQGMLVAALTALFFNDSGITAAAGLALYFLTIVFYSLSTLQQNRI